MDRSKRRAERLACDRCHGQKLRCTRAASSSKACQRCIKAGEKCTYSPPLRLGRPNNKTSQQPQQQQQQQQHGSPDSESSSASTSETPRGIVDDYHGSLACRTSSSMSGIEVLDGRITDLLYPDLQSTAPNSPPMSSTMVASSGCDSVTLATPGHDTDMFDDAFLDGSFFTSHLGPPEQDPAAAVGGGGSVADHTQQQPFAHYGLDDLHTHPAGNGDGDGDGDGTQPQLLRLLSRLQDTPLPSLMEQPDGFKQAVQETAQVSNMLLGIMESVIGPTRAPRSADAPCGCRKEAYQRPHAAPGGEQAGGTNITAFLTMATCYVQILQNIQALSTRLCRMVRSGDEDRTLRDLACIQIGSCGASLATPAIQASMIAQLLSQLLREMQRKVARLSGVATGCPAHVQVRRGPFSSSFTDIISCVNSDIVHMDARVSSELGDILQNC